MYLLILEQIGAQELILVGIVALIVFGPRKLPEMARKAGKMMKEIRSVSDDFRTTWEKEVSDLKDLNPSNILDVESENSILSENTINREPTKIDNEESTTKDILPEIREVSEEDYKKLVEQNKGSEPSESGKQDWL